MKVVLLSDIKGLGTRGDVCEVEDGYAMNFLIPQGQAANVVDEHAKQALQQKDNLNRQHEHTAATEQEVFTRIPETLTIRAAVNEQGTLFSAVTANVVVKQLHEERGITVPLNWFSFDPIKETGNHIVSVTHGELTKEMTVIIDEKKE